ncbi:peptidase M56 [Luteimonas gilva]|uniref:Peptidase M56 n=1 Tax=Luteimonas gilva TaxID=2572684 RepID=A0A4U5JUH0_9GAMM|nr:M56 family metallopeptidase [Luteimonas gilva]TKR33504.1 peptidase M56 [Luteimonas gilva]
MSDPAFVAALGWALIDFLWQGLAVGFAAALTLALLRNARPQARYTVACAALALCAALPLIGLMRGLQTEAAVAVPRTLATMAPPPAAGTEVFAAPLESWRSALQLRLPWIVALWSLGAALLASRMAMGMAWVSRMRRAHAGAVDPRWQARLDRLAGLMGLRRAIALRIAEDLDSPVAAGWWRPLVLVPAALIARMPADLLEALLAHELAHIKRYDYLVNLVQSAIEALLFYHPVVWWLSKRIRAERERIADELAAQALGDPKRLALALQQLDLIGAKDGFAQPHLAPAAHGGNLMSRIQHLVRPDRHALSWKIALPILGLSAICLTVFAQGQAPTAKVAATASAKPAAIAQAKAAPAARSAPSASGRTTGSIQVGGRGPREAYALVRADKDAMTVSGNVNDIREAEKARRSIQGEFLWFRRGSESYVLQDPAMLARVDEAWKPTEALGVRMEALSDKMSGHSKVMEGYGRQMEALSAKHQAPSAEMERTGKEMEAVSEQQQVLADKMRRLSAEMARADSDQQREALDGQMEALQTRMQPLSDRMEALSEKMNAHSARIEASQRPMEELSRQMEQASKPMEALGKQMDALGKQQEQLSRQADGVVRSIIDQALSSGKALPMSKLN